ncbi:hypothetical protein EBR21_00840 [bacterium]|nr:hypothetical protein [bacterium]
MISVFRNCALVILLLLSSAQTTSCNLRTFNKSRGSSQSLLWGMKEYSVACFQELGALPQEVNCDDASEVPMTLKGESIEQKIFDLSKTNSKDKVQCDNPIMSVRDKLLGGCIPGTRLRRMSSATSDFVFICRRRNTFLEGKTAEKGGVSTRLFDTVAFIGHNRETNKVCFVERSNKVEVKSGEPGQPSYLAAAGKMGSEYVPPLVAVNDPRLEKVANQWEPMSVDCTTCHSTKPFVYSPAVSRLKQTSQKGSAAATEAVLPRITRLQRSREGQLNGAPYTLVAEEFLREYIPSKGYITELHPSYGVAVVPEKLKVLGKPRILNTPEAIACGKCHDIGGRDYLRLLVPQISGYFPQALLTHPDSWASFSQYAGRRVGADYVEGQPRVLTIEAHHDETTWKAIFATSPGQNTPQARIALLDALIRCGVDAKAASCNWVPKESVSE